MLVNAKAGVAVPIINSRETIRIMIPLVMERTESPVAARANGYRFGTVSMPNRQPGSGERRTRFRDRHVTKMEYRSRENRTGVTLRYAVN
jgi:hypothetical protein